MCNAGLVTGDRAFFSLFFFFKSNQLRQGASSQHYQVDFQKNKSSCAILYTASGEGKKKKKKKSMKQIETPRVCAHTHKPIVLDISVELISEDYFNDNLTLSSICLSLQLCPKKWQGFRCVRVKTKAENTESGAICSGFAYLIMNVFQRPQDK